MQSKNNTFLSRNYTNAIDFHKWQALHDLIRDTTGSNCALGSHCSNSAHSPPFCPAEHAMAPGVAPLLTGKASKDLRTQVEKIQGNGRKRTLRWFSKFFMVGWT